MCWLTNEGVSTLTKLQPKQLFGPRSAAHPGWPFQNLFDVPWDVRQFCQQTAQKLCKNCAKWVPKVRDIPDTSRYKIKQNQAWCVPFYVQVCKGQRMLFKPRRFDHSTSNVYTSYTSYTSILLLHISWSVEGRRTQDKFRLPWFGSGHGATKVGSGASWSLNRSRCPDCEHFQSRPDIPRACTLEILEILEFGAQGEFRSHGWDD